MKTAALLPTSGDPLLARYWLRNYETWRDEVDALEVYVNGDTASVPLYEAAGAKIVGADPYRLIHGEALTRLVERTDADVVVLMEDDAFVRRPVAIGTHLLAAELGNIIGCPRGGMSPELHEATREKWGPDPVGPDTSAGYGLWPCFLFARTRDLLAVEDHRWISLTWPAGVVIPGLNRSFPVETHTDTGTLMAYQLRERFHIAPAEQWKEMWQKDFADAQRRVGEPNWFHAGGLANEPSAARENIGMESNEGKDWAHRFWWWRRIGHDYREHYERAGLDPDYWTQIIEPWINWEE